MIIIAEIIAWVATLFRGAGMLAKSANTIKYLVSAGNLFWMVNGIMTRNTPLIVSNGFCLAVMLYEIISNKLKMDNRIKQRLIDWAGRYESPAFIIDDPVQFPRKHIGKRAEISGFITSWLAFGNRKAIIKAADWLDKDFCDDPYCWVMTKQYNFYYNDHRKFYRFLSYDDLYKLGDRLRRLYSDFERMEDMIISQPNKTPVEALCNYFKGINGIPDYSKGSACKRLCMFCAGW